MPDPRTPKPLRGPTCRFCGGHQPTEEKGRFVQYGPRHYAHQACYLAAGKSVHALSPEQIALFPRWLLRRYDIDLGEA